MSWLGHEDSCEDSCRLHLKRWTKKVVGGRHVYVQREERWEQSLQTFKPAALDKPVENCATRPRLVHIAVLVLVL